MMVAVGKKDAAPAEQSALWREARGREEKREEESRGEERRGEERGGGACDGEQRQLEPKDGLVRVELPPLAELRGSEVAGHDDDQACSSK